MADPNAATQRSRPEPAGRAHLGGRRKDPDDQDLLDERQEEERHQEDTLKDNAEDAMDARQDAEDAKDDAGR